MGRVSRRHQAKRRRWREAGVAERKLDTSFWLASGGDLEDDASWAGDDRGDSDADDAVDAFLLGANPDGAPDPDDDSGGSEDDADSWAGDGRDGGSDDDMWGVCEDDGGDAASASDPDSDSSDDAWAREWARRLSTDETSPRGASTESGAEEARLAREILGDDVVMADSSDDDSDSSDDASESSDSDGSDDAPPAAYREPLVTTWDKKCKRKSGGYSPRGGIVRARADSKEELRRQRRAAKFAAEAAKAPPPIPKRTFAHPGGRITSNKEEATAKFLQRAKKHLKKQSSP